MSGPGYVFKDSGVAPSAIDESAAMNGTQSAQLGSPSTGKLISHTSQNHLEKDNSSGLVVETTKVLSKQFRASSHELAHEVNAVGGTGAIQKHSIDDDHSGARDIGWHRPTAKIPDPLVFDIPNGRLWSMIRRFNKDVFHVRSLSTEAAQGLDLNEAWSDEYTSDKMTLHLERAYFVVVLNLASLLKQISRLRSWKEARRTTAFCMAYSVAWYLDLLVPLFLGTLISVIASQGARDTLFPPAPRALASISTGGVQTPAAGKLGTTGTLTGAPEKQKGEAVEEEAANFVANFRHLVMRSMGMHDGEDGEGDPLEGKVPKPIKKFVQVLKTEGSAPGHATHGDKQTQKPMEDVIWAQAKPENLTPILKAAPHVLGEVVDDLERLANALSPTPPFSRFSHIRIIALLLPMFLMSFFVDYYIIYKGTSGGIGFAIFGDPIISPVLRWVDRAYPGWTGALNPKYNIFRGVPTTKQLTITILRVGEVHDSPLPPVPSSKPEDTDQPTTIDINKVPLGASPIEIAQAIQPASPTGTSTEKESEGIGRAGSQHKHISKFIRLLKRTTQGAVDGKLGIDHVRAKVGSEKTKDRFGVFIKPEDLIYANPDMFKARFEGKSGWIYITEDATPRLLFSTQTPDPNGGPDKKDISFEIPIDHIQSLKRASAIVTKPLEKAVDWSSEMELLASLELEDQSGKSRRFTALPERDELFNRLVAIGDQHWENV